MKKTTSGEVILHAPDGAKVPDNEGWIVPTVNPFGHACCDCGLYHLVEFALVDQEGNEILFPDGARLALRFTREEIETEKLRRRKVHEWPESPRVKARKSTELLRKFLEESVAPLPEVPTKATVEVERFLFGAVTSGQVAGTDFSGVPITSMTRDALLSLVALLAAGKPEEKEESRIIRVG